MTKASTIYQFWNSFGLTAYEENSVPDEADFPYITYQFVTDSFDREIPLTVSIWYRSESWTAINAKTEEISQKISRGGKVIPCDGGAIWLKRGQPFAQSMGDESDNLIKRKYLNMTAEFMTADGTEGKI